MSGYSSFMEPGNQKSEIMTFCGLLRLLFDFEKLICVFTSRAAAGQVVPFVGLGRLSI